MKNQCYSYGVKTCGIARLVEKQCHVPYIVSCVKTLQRRRHEVPLWKGDKDNYGGFTGEKVSMCMSEDINAKVEWPEWMDLPIMFWVDWEVLEFVRKAKKVQRMWR